MLLLVIMNYWSKLQCLTIEDISFSLLYPKFKNLSRDSLYSQEGIYYS